MHVSRYVSEYFRFTMDHGVAYITYLTPTFTKARQLNVRSRPGRGEQQASVRAYVVKTEQCFARMLGLLFSMKSSLAGAAWIQHR